jgi:hypothetical protein
LRSARAPIAGARAIERREAGEAEPGLVPQEDEIGLIARHSSITAAHVVDVTVEGAVGQRDRLHLVEPARRLEVEQAFLRLRIGTAPYIEYATIGKAST